MARAYGHARAGLPAGLSCAAFFLLALLGLTAAGCTGVAVNEAPPPSTSAPGKAGPNPVITPSPGPSAVAPITQPASRWLPVSWRELPGWQEDRLGQALPALRRNCETRAPSPTLASLCAEVQRVPANADDAAVRAWLIQRFDVYRVEAPDGRAEGLATGYFEPMLEASRQPRGAWRHALHGLPSGYVSGQPWYTRKESQTLPTAINALRGREIAYVADPLEVLVLQIQGSGRALITEPDGRRSQVRLAFAGHNERSYQSVGRWLIDQGELTRDGASWPAIRDWARRNPARLNEMLWVNPRLVFFKEEPLPDPALGPRGAQGVPLTAERSIAVDPRSIPYGTPVWLDTTEPSTSRPLRRLVVAQDTGSAITGAVRADYFWGTGERAEQQAGRMKQALRLWTLVPKLSTQSP